MYVRVATFEGIDIEAAKRSSDAVHLRLMPVFDAMPGWQGAMDVADPATGKVISMSFFNSEENAKASEPTFDEEFPKVLGELMESWAGKRVSVDQCEVIFQLPR